MSADAYAAAIACNRFGLGARAGELATVRGNERDWLRSQLRGGAPLLGSAALSEGTVRLQSTQDILAGAAPIVQQARERRRQASAAAATPSNADSGNADANAALASFMRLPQYFRPLYLAEVQARLYAAATTSRPFVERLVYFWSNHFAVSVDKIAVLGIAGSMEREAIRPHVLGRFEELLLAVEQHPAMLLYLDNQQSIGPNSKVASRAEARGRVLGLNENLARESMELHTIGVDGGYTQADVSSLARVLTGWSIGGGQGLRQRGAPGEFVFRPELHEPGAQRVLGRRYGQDGLAQGTAVLSDLAASSATAHHIATKLVRHFIADDPPAAAVKRVASAFERSSGDLPAVYAALINCEQGWETPFAKFKTPQDYIVSAHRALGLTPQPGARSLAAFEVLGQRQFAPGSPAGWPDRSDDWDGAAALMKRIELADAMAQKLSTSVDAADLAPQLWGDALSVATRTVIAQAASATQALTLLLTAPEFLRR